MFIGKAHRIDLWHICICRCTHINIHTHTFNNSVLSNRCIYNIRQ